MNKNWNDAGRKVQPGVTKWRNVWSHFTCSHRRLCFPHNKSHIMKSRLPSSFPAAQGLIPLKHTQKDVKWCEITCDMCYSYAIPSIHPVKVKVSVKYLNPKVILLAVPKNKVRESLIRRPHPLGTTRPVQNQWQSIDQLLRYCSLDQNSRLTKKHFNLSDKNVNIDPICIT